MFINEGDTVFDVFATIGKKKIGSLVNILVCENRVQKSTSTVY